MSLKTSPEENRRKTIRAKTPQQQNLFDKQKRLVLQEVEAAFDNSRKGSVDALILDFLSQLNGHPDFFSLSSCSGRISVISNRDLRSDSSVRKKGCTWLHISHEAVETETIWKAVENRDGAAAVTLKFEPFILHVQCRDLEAAKRLHTLSLEAGYRNSGLTLGKSGKITLAVRSTHGLEVPLTDPEGNLLVDRRYIDFVVGEANRKLGENEVKFRSFESKVFSSLGLESVASDCKQEES